MKSKNETEKSDRGSCNELELIRLTASGDEHAFEMLYAKFYKPLFRFIYRLTGRMDIVDALINEVMF
ncbi:MAG: RNA polymerase subunit sigma-24, partial [Gammaproteobacteria bacterium]|nr:RNA polymerase subunit sigma-24 [Gammaproteobacteria bacterium]